MEWNKKIEMLDGMDAVIFDLDGTLVDSMWVWRAVDQEFYDKYDLTEPENFYEQMEGKSYTEVAQLYVDSFPQLHTTVDRLKEEWTKMTYEKYANEVALKKGADEFIFHIKEMGKKLAIATSNTKELVKAVLAHYGLLDSFDFICTSCEAGAGKPAPDVYLMAADRLQVNPENCLVFEDIPNGILAGKNAGMTVCAVKDQDEEEPEQKKKELADYYINNYEDIKRETYEVLK